MQNLAFAQVGAKGMFTKEIEDALVEGRIDLAVHSLKDLPTTLDEPFTLAAIPERADPRDVLVSVQYESFASLPAGSRIGTSSLRRRAQLGAQRRDLKYVEFRGNVDTRLRKLAEGQVEALILAAAGLERLGRMEHVRERFAALVLCPAAGQGALAVETRADDAGTIGALGFLDDGATRFAVTAERTALAALGGGCQVPIGIHCSFIESKWFITGVVATPDGSGVVREELERDEGVEAEALGEELAQRLLEQGAGELLQASLP
jgi:hydroxymethylbilane synthase